MLRNADVAMYSVKTQGKAGYQVFEPTMHEARAARLALKADLQRAVDNGEFSLVYQPTVSIKTGAFTGVEALVRWHHPRRA